jgi:MFS family permease
MLPTQVLRIPAFRNLWLGQAISQLGDACYYVVFMFMVHQVTGSYAMVGYVGALETAPYLLFSAHAGVFADRFDRRRIMLLSDVLCGLLLTLFALVVYLEPKPPFLLIGAVAFLISSVRVFFWPAKNASIPRLVPKESVMEANALSMMTQNVMFLVGLGFSGGVLAALYAISPVTFYVGVFAFNAASFFGSAYFISRLSAVLPDRDAEPQNPLVEVREGFGYIRRRHELVVLLFLQMLLTLFISPFFPVYVASNNEWFGGRPASLLWFEFSFFLGYIVGSAMVARFNPRRPGIGFIWGCTIVGASVAAMAFSPNLWLFMLWNLVAGLALPFSNIPIMTYLQVTVEDKFRGRVNSAWNMLAVGMQPLGLALAGLFLQRFGIVACFLAMGIGVAAAALLGLADGPFRAARLPDSTRESEEAAGLAQAPPPADIEPSGVEVLPALEGAQLPK